MSNHRPDAPAEQALTRFDRQIKTAAHYVANKFAPEAELDDVTQEASIMILQYTGTMPGGRHNNCIAKVERDAERDEARVCKIILTKLYLDLENKIGREVAKYRNEIPTDLNPETLREPGSDSYDPTDGMMSEIDFERELPRLRRDYPHLIASVVDELTETEIAEALGVDRSTVNRHITQEKAQAANDPFFWLLARDGKPVRRRTPSSSYKLAA
jgi:hypothetical protein